MKQNISSPKTDVYYIHLENNMQSLLYGGYVGEKWKSFKNLETYFFPGISPPDFYRRSILKYAPLKKSIKSTRPFTITEKCVWESHFAIWKLLKHSNAIGAIVAEHDAMPLDVISKFSLQDFYDKAYDKTKYRGGYIPLSFTDSRYIGKRVQPANCYFVTKKFVEGAERYIDKHEKKISVNTDGWLHFMNNTMMSRNNLREIDIEDMWLARPIDMLYNQKTIVHAGSDDEEIDIPSLRW